VEVEGIIGQFVNQVVIRAEIAPDITVSDLIARVREAVWDAVANQDAPFDQVLRNLAGTHTPTDDLFPINFVCQQEFGRGGPHEIEFSGIRMSTLPSKSQGALYDLNFFLVEREVGWRLSLEYKSNLYTHDTALSLLDHFVEILRAFVTGPAQPLSGLALTQSGPLLRRLASTAETAAAATPQGGQHEAGVELQAMPASPAQERFWTLSQVDPSNAGFHIPVTVGVMGQLSPTLLEKSFQQLVDRHETLRTTFSEIDGSLMQVIHPGYKFSLETAAIAGVDKDERAKHLNALICAEVERPYDLASLPLFRGLLCRLSSDENVLVLTIHHCIADAASVQVFQRELWAAYEGLSSGSVVAAAPLELQYGDFSVWQRENLNSDLVKANLDYWLKLLSGDLPILNFPTDRPPSYNVASHGAIETQLLPEELARGLKQLAQSSDVTLFVLALAAFALVLGRASCAEDLIVGSPVVNRRMETETLIGPFAGPVALRLNLSGNPTLREFVLSVRNATFEALSHVELPFEVLLEKLKIKPSGGRKPLFQFYFFCQPAFLQSHRLPGLEVTPLPTTSLGIPFELQLGVIERAEGIRAELEYNSGLFDKATIREWLGYYQMILTRLVSNPDLKIGALPAPPFMASPAHLEMPGNGGPQGSQELRLNRDRAQPHVGGHEKLEADLVAIWAGVLKIQVMDVDDNFFAVGGRSLDAARLMTRINKKYSVTLGLATLFKYPTIRQFAQLVRGETAVPAPSSVVAIQPEGNAAPLFVVHGVGGNVLNFYDLARELGVNQPVYGIEAQALQVADAPITAFEELAAYYVREVKQVQAFGPYHFLGYSYGGLVAFEMARQLQAAGERVALLGMLDTPIWRHDNNPRYGTMARMGRQLRAIWSPFFQRLRPLTPPEIFDGVKSTLLRAFYTVAISQGRQIPASLRSVYHINSYAAVNYVPQEYKGKVTMLRASRERGPRDLGWGKFTTELVDVYEIPGAHLEVLSDKNMPAVIRVLKDHLRNE
jgi:thioesterase domain-containing protein/aryl carrier-like protein